MSMTLTAIGTPSYLSPLLFEAFKNNLNDCHHDPEKSEVFSLGISILKAAKLLSSAEIKNLNDKQ